MIQVIKSEERHAADFGWLKTHWHFSFGDYWDPTNVSFGPLRVFNDDVVEAGKGFGMHPHRDMEIVTYVIDGELEHKDHIGNRGVVRGGEVQVMSAGKGIMHAEYEHSGTRPVRLMQLWIEPRSKGGKPRWEQKQFSVEERKGRLLPVVSGGEGQTLRIDQDATIYVSNVPAGERVVHRTGAGRRVYLYAIGGEVSVNGKEVREGDQARIEGETQLDVVASKDAELVLIDLP
jgi:hypothetical protein